MIRMTSNCGTVGFGMKIAGALSEFERRHKDNAEYERQSLLIPQGTRTTIHSFFGRAAPEISDHRGSIGDCGKQIWLTRNIAAGVIPPWHSGAHYRALSAAPVEVSFERSVTRSDVVWH